MGTTAEEEVPLEIISSPHLPPWTMASIKKPSGPNTAPQGQAQGSRQRIDQVHKRSTGSSRVSAAAKHRASRPANRYSRLVGRQDRARLNLQEGIDLEPVSPVAAKAGR